MDLSEAERIVRKEAHEEDLRALKVLLAEYDRRGAIEQRARTIAEGAPPEHSVWPPLFASGRQHSARYILTGQ